VIEEYEKAIKEKEIEIKEVNKVLSDLANNGIIADGVPVVPPKINILDHIALHDKEIQLNIELEELFDKLRLSRSIDQKHIN